MADWEAVLIEDALLACPLAAGSLEGTWEGVT